MSHICGSQIKHEFGEVVYPDGNRVVSDEKGVMHSDHPPYVVLRIASCEEYAKTHDLEFCPVSDEHWHYEISMD